MMKMPQIPQDRYTRAFSTAAALLLQVGFLFLMLQALKTAPLRHELSRELTLILPRLPVVVPAPAPAQNAAPPQNRVILPEVTAPVPPEASTTPAFQSITPPSSIQGFGQALNNCAPENYANLTEDQKALCTRPGAGVTVQSAPNLMGAPSEVKDPAR